MPIVISPRGDEPTTGRMVMDAHAVTGFPPKVFLIGAQKAGTTFLAGLLDQHPRISVASPKEPHYLTRNRSRDIDWYRGCFPGFSPDDVLVDASPSYTAAPTEDHPGGGEAGDNPYVGVPGRIENMSPDARFIYLVRDPVARIHSGYWHAVRTGAEKRPFEEAIRRGSHYRRVSDYYGQLMLYLERFRDERFLILRFEDLVRDPDEIVRQCTKWIGVQGLENMDIAHGQNRSAVYTGPARALDWLLAPAGGLKAGTAMGKRLLPERTQRWLKTRLTSPIPAMPSDAREWLLEEYRPMAVQFERRTGVQLYPWANGPDK